MRSWLTASLLVISGLAGVLVAPSPAASVENVRWHVWVSDAGYSVREIKATEGDVLVFELDVNNVAPDSRHTVTWDQGHLSKELTRTDKTWTLPLNNAGKAEYWDWFHYTSDNPNRMAFYGTLEVAKAPATQPPSSTTTSSTSTTVTTAPPTTTTKPTTTTTKPTTTTTATPIRLQFVPDPPTTSTTAAPAPPAPPTTEVPAPPTTAKKDKSKDKVKDKKPAENETTTTTAPAASPAEIIFDSESLTPGPTMMPMSEGGSEDEAAINAAAVANLLDAPKPDDERNYLLLFALGGVAALLFLIAACAWFTRASRYDPA